MGARNSTWSGLPLLLGGLACIAPAAEPPPASHLPAGQIPALVQSDPAAGLPNGGRMFCAPVAVSNSLMAIFADEFGREGMTQLDLVLLLASDGYMYTHPEKGTKPGQLLRAVQRFVRKRGIADFSLRFQGLRDHEHQFGRGFHKPQLRWIQSSLARGAGVWLNIGWYHFDPNTAVYQRHDGHWLTAVGYGLDARGEPDPDMLVVLDPRTAGLSHVKLTPRRSGTIEGASKNFAFPANGIYQLETGLPLKKGADYALLDGVVVLSLGE